MLIFLIDNIISSDNLATIDNIVNNSVRINLGTPFQHHNARAVAMNKQQQKKRYPPQERKKQLLDIAVEVFADQGISAARHAEIAKRAGVAVSTIFFYFPTRDDLVDAVLGETERVFGDLPQNIDIDPETPTIWRILHIFLEYIDRYPNHSRILFEWSASIREAVWPRFLKLQEKLIEGMANRIIEERIEQNPGAPPEELATLLMGVAYVLYIMKFSEKSQQEVEKFVDWLVATLS